MCLFQKKCEVLWNRKQSRCVWSSALFEKTLVEKFFLAQKMNAYNATTDFSSSSAQVQPQPVGKKYRWWAFSYLIGMVWGFKKGADYWFFINIFYSFAPFSCFLPPLLDWAACIVLMIVGVLFATLVPPFKRYLPPNDPSVSFPYTPDIIPTWLLVLICAIVSIGAILIGQLCYRSLHDLHHALLTLAETNTLTFFLTNFLKTIVARYRPTYLAIMADPNMSELTKRDAHFSFPSGHASSAFCTMLFVSLYLAGKTGLFNKHSHSIALKLPRLLLIVFAPLSVATMISVSRTMDYHHNFSDVLAGTVLGCFVAVMCYFANYGSLLSSTSHLPHNSYHTRAYFAASRDKGILMNASDAAANDAEEEAHQQEKSILPQ